MLDGMLSKTLSWEERHEYICMLQKFPRLFAKDYTDVRGVDIIQHKIDLKPQATPKAQKLRRLGVIKEQALLKEVRKLLSAGFSYPVEKIQSGSLRLWWLRRKTESGGCVSTIDHSMRQCWPSDRNVRRQIINSIAGTTLCRTDGSMTQPHETEL